MSTRGQLSSRERAVVAALAAGLTKKEAAATVGVRPETVSRYLRDPQVCAAIKEAQDQSLAQITRRMGAGSNTALDVLQAVMADAAMAPAVRVRAALGWLEQAWKARELSELTERVSELERRLEP